MRVGGNSTLFVNCLQTIYAVIKRTGDIRTHKQDGGRAFGLVLTYDGDCILSFYLHDRSV